MSTAHAQRDLQCWSPNNGTILGDVLSAIGSGISTGVTATINAVGTAVASAVNAIGQASKPGEGSGSESVEFPVVTISDINPGTAGINPYGDETTSNGDGTNPTGGISASSGDPGTVAINTTTTIGSSGTGITVMQPPTFTTTTPCQKASEQLGKQNLKDMIKKLNGKTSGNHEWGQVIKESFQNKVDLSKNINGIIQSVDDLTPGSDATIDPNGTTIYRYKLPKFSLDNKSEDNPRVIGYMHSHTDDIFPSCFSPADLVIFKNACEGSVDESVTPPKLNNTFDNVERANYFNDAIGIMVDKNNVYTVKITDPAGFCVLMGSKNLDAWERLFDDAAKVPTDDNNGKQGQSVAFLQLFGKVVSLQQAKIDGTTGNLGDFKHLTLADERYLPPNDPLNPIDSKKIEPVDCGK